MGVELVEQLTNEGKRVLYVDSQPTSTFRTVVTPLDDSCVKIEFIEDVTPTPS